MSNMLERIGFNKILPLEHPLLEAIGIYVSRMIVLLAVIFANFVLLGAAVLFMRSPKIFVLAGISIGATLCLIVITRLGVSKLQTFTQASRREFPIPFRGEVPTTTFPEIAGYEKVKLELQAIVEYLRSPDSSDQLEAQPPRNILLAGSPGAVKDMLVSAVANSANVPLYHEHGPTFVDLFVGVGTARIRRLFEEAKQHAPSIVFIDQIESLHYPALLSQLLNELDELVHTSSSVIFIAGTDRMNELASPLIRRLNQVVEMSMESTATTAGGAITGASIPLIVDFFRRRKERGAIAVRLTETDGHIIEGAEVQEPFIEEVDGERFIVISLPQTPNIHVPLSGLKTIEFPNTSIGELLEAMEISQWDNAEHFLQANNDAWLVVSELHDKGALSASELKTILEQEGYPMTMRAVERRLDALINLGIVQKRGLFRYELHLDARNRIFA